MTIEEASMCYDGPEAVRRAADKAAHDVDGPVDKKEETDFVEHREVKRAV
jgi:hypothetical protein